MELVSSYFFELSQFSHASLFKQASFPWQILPQIEPYLRSQALGSIKGVVSSQAYLIHPDQISIDEGSIVEPGAYIQGPCLIGKNCIVRHGAYIRGNFICGDRCVIGHDTEIKNAVFLNDTHAAHFAYVGDSILGNRVNLGAGTKCANLKLDQSFIVLRCENQPITTSLRKFGVIVGDGTQIGCNTVTNPGTLIGQDVRCYPCLNVGGIIPSRSIIKGNNQLVITSY